MAAPVIDNLNSAKKRKRKGESIGRLKKKSKATLDVHQDATVQNEILQLEEKILNSRTNYNEISTLIKLLRPTDSARQTDVVAAVGLCRVFCKLMAVGSLSKPRESSGNEAIIVRWLRERLQDYEEALLAMLRHEDVGKQSTALTLLLRLAKVRAAHLDKSEDDMWRDGVFKKILKLLVVDDEIAEETRKEFLEKYVEGYDDIRYYTFGHLAYVPSCPDRRYADLMKRSCFEWCFGSEFEETALDLGCHRNDPATAGRIRIFLYWPSKQSKTRSLLPDCT